MVYSSLQDDTKSCGLIGSLETIINEYISYLSHQAPWVLIIAARRTITEANQGEQGYNEGNSADQDILDYNITILRLS